MRSSVALVALCLGGCDMVFGLDGEATPCDVASFDGATPVDVINAEDFSFDWDETFGVVQVDGLHYEISPSDAALTPIDIGPYTAQSLSLTPEGNALFYTVTIEPLTLKGALRGGPAQWLTDAGVPRGTFAGTPSADIYGPRRLMVRMRDGEQEPVQEYEDKSGVWTPVGDPRLMTTHRAPNLSVDGLTMVYAGVTEAGEAAVLVAQRTSIDAPFGAATPILAGAFSNAQLLSRCSRLYTSDGVTLRRYDR